MVRLTAFLLVVCLLVPVSGATAAIVPPGNSGATQYSETLPSAAGEETHRGGPGGPSANESSSVSAQTAAELQELGPEGQAALSVAAAGAPAHPGGGHHAKAHPNKQHGAEHHGGKHEGAAGVAASGGGAGGPTAQASPGGSSEAGGSSSAHGVLAGVFGTSGGGLDILQPLILAMILVGAGAYMLRRRIRRPT